MVSPLSHFRDALDRCTDGNLLVRALPPLMRNCTTPEKQAHFCREIKKILLQLCSNNYSNSNSSSTGDSDSAFTERALQLACNQLEPRGPPVGAVGGTTNSLQVLEPKTQIVQAVTVAAAGPESLTVSEPALKRQKVEAASSETVSVTTAESTVVSSTSVNEFNAESKSMNNGQESKNSVTKSEPDATANSKPAATAAEPQSSDPHQPLSLDLQLAHRTKPLSIYIGSLLYTIDEQALFNFITKDMGLKSVKSLKSENDNSTSSSEEPGVIIYKTPAGKSKGGAKVTFQDKEDFKRGLQLNGVELRGRKMIVNDFYKHNKFGGYQGIPQGIQNQTIVGQGPAQKILNDNHNNQNTVTKGSGSNESLTHDHAMDGDTSDPIHRTVVVKNLSFHANEANLGELFAGCGEIHQVRIARDKRDPTKPAGYAMVEFTHRGAIQKALSRSGRIVRERTVRVEGMGGRESNNISNTTVTDSSQDPNSIQIQNGEGGVQAQGYQQGKNSNYIKGKGKKEGSKGNFKGKKKGGKDQSDDIELKDAHEPIDANGNDAVETTESQGPTEATVTVSTDNVTTTSETVPTSNGVPSEVQSSTTESSDPPLTWPLFLSIIESYSTEEALRNSLSDDKIKKYLIDLNLKAGGKPEERLGRLMEAAEYDDFESCPKNLKSKK